MNRVAFDAKLYIFVCIFARKFLAYLTENNQKCTKSILILTPSYRINHSFYHKNWKFYTACELWYFGLIIEYVVSFFSVFFPSFIFFLFSSLSMWLEVIKFKAEFRYDFWYHAIIWCGGQLSVKQFGARNNMLLFPEY